MDKLTKGNLFLKPDEGKFLGVSVVMTLEKLQNVGSNPDIPFNPETRKLMKEMIDSGKRLKIKLERLGFDCRPLPDLEPGEENDYLTKES